MDLGLRLRPGNLFRLPAHSSFEGVSPVAATCDICGKRPGFGNSISHSHRRTPRRWYPNIQSVRTVVNGTPKRIKVCTSCIKAGKVSR
jgi:large subunit ribosomal protein L28